MQKTIRSAWRSLALGALLALSAAPIATAQAPKTVTFANGDQMRVTYYWLYLPEILGYWKQEGLDVRMQAVGGSVEALQQLAAGRAEFGQLGSNVVIQSNVKENIPARVIMLNGVVQWALAVPTNSPIQKPADLKGKNIGVFSLSTNGNLFLRAFLKENGVQPDTDSKFIAVGFGGPALQALQRNEVAGLYFWPSAFVTYENQGASFRYFRAPEWERYPDYAVATMQGIIEKDPKTVEGMVRGMVKALVFAEASPECTIKAYWSKYPDTKPTNVSEAVAFENAMRSLKAQMHENELAYKLYGSKFWGATGPKEFGQLQDFFVEAGLIDRKIDPANFVVGIDGFYERTNSFDQAAVAAQAKNCAYK